MFLGIGISLTIIIISVLLFTILAGQEKKLQNTLFIYERNKQYKEAIEIAKKLIRKKSKSPIYYIRLAGLYTKAKQIKEALGIYLTMLRQNLFSPTISQKMILEQAIPLLLQIKDTGTTWKLIQNLLAIDSKNSVALIGLARLHAGQEKLSEAAGYLKRVIERDSNNAEAHFFYGLVLLDGGNLRTGVVEIEKSLKINKNNPKALYFLALGYGQLGHSDKKDKILKTLNISLDGVPTNITKAGILKFSSKINIDDLKKQNQKTKSTIIKDWTTFLTSSGEGFYSTVTNILKKLGISITGTPKIEVDTTVELYFLGTYKQQDCLVQFYKTDKPISSITISDFLTNLDNSGAHLGIHITTSHLSADAANIIEKEENAITFDKSKIQRFFN